jgi:GT2 family glycosyltransferase
MILNRNGAAYLAEFLPSIVAAADAADAEVWVVDNHSDDHSLDLCRELFPTVRLEALEDNRMLAAYNTAAEHCDTDIFVALNNDVLVEHDFLAPLLRQFERDPAVFAVSSWIRTYPPESHGDHGEATNVRWVRGMLRGGERQRTDRPMPVFYNCGCATAYDRRKFVSLGGFDPLFFPFYYEDTDLSWRAWKRGWTCLYEPSSVVYHKGGGSIGRSENVKATLLRNEFLFHWKNLSDPSLVARHAASILPRLLIASIRRDKARLEGFGQALRLARRALACRQDTRDSARVSDATVIARINSPVI